MVISSDSAVSPTHSAAALLGGQGAISEDLGLRGQVQP